MLGDRISLNIYIENNKCLNLNMRTLKNLFMLTGENPFLILTNFLQDDNKDFYNILLAMSDLELSVNEVIELVESDKTKEAIYYLISNELIDEVETELEHNVEEHNTEEINYKKSFLDFWNYHYYTMVYKLKVPEKEFYRLSVREVKTICSYARADMKNSILSAYVEIMKAQNNNRNTNKNEQEQLVATKNNGVRIKDLLLSRQ